MLHNARIPIVGFAAWSGTGKTTLLTRIVPLLRDAGLRVGVVKHAHHNFEIDREGKDSYQLRMAGASQMMIASSKRWALMVEREVESEVSLDDVLLDVEQGDLDVILVEGFKSESFAKIELRRTARKAPRIEDPNIIAIASDTPEDEDTHLPVLDLNSPDAIAQFIVEKIVAAHEHSGAGNETVANV